MDKVKKCRWFYWGLPVLGALFCLWYLKNATCDIIYSDYIRLVNSYLPDVYDPAKVFVPDILTRIPITFLGRIINVELFGYSVTFDRVLGILGLMLAGWVIGLYCMRKRIGPLWFALAMAVMFSLNKWEMMINGTGWCHFFAFACFYWHWMVLDRVVTGKGKPMDRVLLVLLPCLITLGTAGPYCAVYSAVLLFSYLWAFLLALRERGERRWEYAVYGIFTLIPVFLYAVSSSLSEEGITGIIPYYTIGEILEFNPWFPVRFALNSFASVLVGGEELGKWLEEGTITQLQCCLIGAAVVAGYLWALWLNIRLRLYRKTLYPLMLLAAGFMNHILIFLSRYAFGREDYAMSSRYTLQFQVGIIGMILTMALAFQAERGILAARRLLAAGLCLAILAGNGYTTYQELVIKAPYREERFEQMAQGAFCYEDMGDKELAALYEYTKGRDAIENAFQILKDNHLNIFRDQ